MEIRDVIHGVIQIENHELPVVDSFAFQRLRLIKATGFAENSYPGACHSRYTHSLGAFHTATLAFEAIFPELKNTNPDQYRTFRALVRMGALLHDIGHGPFSHTTENAMPPAKQIEVPGLIFEAGAKNRKATHEDYTLKIILDSPLTPVLEKQLAPFGIEPKHIAAIIDAEYPVTDSFFLVHTNGEKTNFRPVLHQLISSELDADRMDYLKRDSFYAGVSYGVFDGAWIINNLTTHVQKGSCYLALNHKALYAFEDFLLSRYHMFLMVYLHHKTVVYDEMLTKFLTTPESGYALPSDIEAYLQTNDLELLSFLSKSKNTWAKRIVEKKPFRMILETHSGIPSGQKAQDQQDQLFQDVLVRLKKDKIEYIESKSKGELSKYFGKSADPIFVRYNNLYSKPSYIPLEKCTPLFTQYPQVRSISRVYVSPEDYAKIRSESRNITLDFENE